MAFKDNYFVYSSKKFTTGLTDVTARVRKDGVYVLGTDTTPLSLTELANGRYQLVLTAAQISGLGAGWYEVDVDSASQSAPATALRYISENDSDDVITELAAVDAKVDIIDANVDQALLDIADVKTVVDNNNSELISGTYGLSALKTLIDSIQSTVDNISNVTRFSAPIPAQLIRLASGNKLYKIPVRLFDNNGNPEDPDSNQIQLKITNQGGTARDSYISGFTAQPHYITRTGVGIYEFDLSIPDTAALEGLNFEFIYVENGVTNSQIAITEVVEDVQASGLALEATSQDILTDTADMQPRVLDIQTEINNATYGLAALKTLLDTIAGYTDSVEGELANATYGLSALRTQLDLKASQASVDAIQSDITDDVKGAGFDQAEDTLHQISLRVFNGGVIV